MAKITPRRTAERIPEGTLALFNRFGDPNVSTTLICAELGISPGNLYYHYPANAQPALLRGARQAMKLAACVSQAAPARAFAGPGGGRQRPDE